MTKPRVAGIEGVLLPLLRDYLSNIYLRVSVGGRESEEQPMVAGIPQGNGKCSELGPTHNVIHLLFISG